MNTARTCRRDLVSPDLKAQLLQCGHRDRPRSVVGVALRRTLAAAYVDGLQVELLDERLDQLVIGNQSHVLGDAADQLTRVLTLLFDQHFQLIVGNKTQVDKNLTETSYGHATPVPCLILGLEEKL